MHRPTSPDDAEVTALGGRRIESPDVIPDERIPPRRRALLQGRDGALDAALDWIEVRAAATTVAGGS